MVGSAAISFAYSGSFSLTYAQVNENPSEALIMMFLSENYFSFAYLEIELYFFDDFVSSESSIASEPSSSSIY